jgi:hypothetical protein
MPLLRSFNIKGMNVFYHNAAPPELEAASPVRGDIMVEIILRVFIKAL